LWMDTSHRRCRRQRWAGHPMATNQRDRQGDLMAGETISTVVGTLTDDPELRFTPSGAAVANFTVASTPRTFDKNSNEWVDQQAMFLRCSIWRQPHENIRWHLPRAQ